MRGNSLSLIPAEDQEQARLRRLQRLVDVAEQIRALHGGYVRTCELGFSAQGAEDLSSVGAERTVVRLNEHTVIDVWRLTVNGVTFVANDMPRLEPEVQS